LGKFRWAGVRAARETLNNLRIGSFLVDIVHQERKPALLDPLYSVIAKSFGFRPIV